MFELAPKFKKMDVPDVIFVSEEQVLDGVRHFGHAIISLKAILRAMG